MSDKVDEIKKLLDEEIKRNMISLGKLQIQMVALKVLVNLSLLLHEKESPGISRQLRKIAHDEAKKFRDNYLPFIPLEDEAGYKANTNGNTFENLNDIKRQLEELSFQNPDDQNTAN